MDIAVNKEFQILTDVVERCLWQRLRDDALQLPAASLERQAFIVGGKATRCLFSMWPAHPFRLDSAYWDIATGYALGLPPRTVRPYVGAHIGDTDRLVDPFGAHVACAPLPGDGWRTAHDTLVCVILHLAQEAGAHAAREVYNDFACQPGLSPAAAAADPDDPHWRRNRNGAVPDLVLRVPADGGIPGPERLYEFKFLHHVRAKYNRVNDTQPSRAVNRLADSFPAMYRRKIRRLDSRFDTTGAHTADGGKGPAEQRLDQFGRVRGLVIGAFGEFSTDLDSLVSALADAASHTLWRDMLCPSALGAKAVLLHLYRAAIFFAGVRENAHLIHSRLLAFAHGGPGMGACRPPPPGLQMPSRYKDFATDWHGGGAYLGRSARYGRL